MKKCILYSIVVFLTVLLISCTDDQSSYMPFSVDDQDINVPAAGAYAGFVIHTMETWTVINPEGVNWVSFVSNSSGQYSKKVVVKVELNMTTAPRTTTLIVECDGQRREIIIRQAANTLPGAAGTINGADGNLCPDEDVVVLSVAPISSADVYIWYRNGVEIATTTKPTYTVTTPGTGDYTVVGKNVIGFGAVSAVKTVTITVCPPTFVDQLVGTWTVTEVQHWFSNVSWNPGASGWQGARTHKIKILKRTSKTIKIHGLASSDREDEVIGEVNDAVPGAERIIIHAQFIEPAWDANYRTKFYPCVDGPSRQPEVGIDMDLDMLIKTVGGKFTIDVLGVGYSVPDFAYVFGAIHPTENVFVGHRFFNSTVKWVKD